MIWILIALLTISPFVERRRWKNAAAVAIMVVPLAAGVHTMHTSAVSLMSIMVIMATMATMAVDASLLPAAGEAVVVAAVVVEAVGGTYPCYPHVCIL